jgi:uncharacterized coiled-coil DUF342 family protein
MIECRVMIIESSPKFVELSKYQICIILLLYQCVYKPEGKYWGLHSADQNFAEKDVESLNWNELLNLKHSLSSFLKETSNKIIEIERSKIQTLNNKIHTSGDELKLLLNKSREVRSSIKAKNSEFLTISQKISQSKDFLITMESRLSDESEEKVVRSIEILTDRIDGKHYGTESERNRIAQELKDKSMNMEAIKAVKTIKQGLDQLNQQADTFKQGIRILNQEILDLDNRLNNCRLAVDVLYNERRKSWSERGTLLDVYNASLEKLELINLQMDKVAKVRRQHLHLPGQRVSDNEILKVKEEAKRKLDSGSKLSFEELKLLYTDGD